MADYNNESRAWEQSAASRETGATVMRAIWQIAIRETRDAEAAHDLAHDIWSCPTEEQITEVRKRVRRYAIPGDSLCWGFEGEKWLSGR